MFKVHMIATAPHVAAPKSTVGVNLLTPDMPYFVIQRSTIYSEPAAESAKQFKSCLFVKRSVPTLG